MSNLTKFFQTGKSGENPKKIREVCLECSQINPTSDILDVIFTENLNSHDCVIILFNCLKNLECKMR